MKRYILVLSLLILFFNLTAQNSEEMNRSVESEVNGNTTAEKAQAPEIITKLNILQHVDVDEYKLTFKSVESDGRCPENVTCVWPGEAKILVDIYNGTDSKSKAVTIPAMGFHKKIFTTSQHVVYLKNLAPYPVNSKDKIKAYQLLLKIQPKNF